MAKASGERQSCFDDVFHDLEISINFQTWRLVPEAQTLKLGNSTSYFEVRVLDNSLGFSCCFPENWDRIAVVYESGMSIFPVRMGVALVS